MISGVGLKQIRREIERQLGRYQPVLLVAGGILGDGQDNVHVPNLPNYAYVRTGNEEAPDKVLNLRVPYINEYPVWVGFDALEPTIYQVLGFRNDAYARSGQSPIPSLPEHGWTHQWGSSGYDLVWPDFEQIATLMLRPAPGLGNFWVRLHDGPLPVIGGGWIYVSAAEGNTTTLNLAGDVPVVGGRTVLVYLDVSGDLQRRLGDIVVIPDLHISQTPAINYGESPIASVRLYSTQVRIRHDYVVQDIMQLRFPQTPWLYPHTIISDTHTDTDTGDVPADGDVLTWDSIVDKWYPRAPTGGDGDGGATIQTPCPHWVADGPLAVVNEVDGVWLITVPFRVTAVWMYCQNAGTAGSTIIDVDWSNDGVAWNTIFANPADRPTLPWNEADHQAASVPTNPTFLSVGDLLRMNVEQVATAVRNLSVQVEGRYSPSMGSSEMPIIGIA